jgi:PHD/YefM family antitoxin component YafN of YafNO toxin-antitoxin module
MREAMEIYTEDQAKENLHKIIDYVEQAHEPVYILGKHHKVVILSEEDYSAIQETLYLVSQPGMREAILEGSKEPLDKCSDKLDW